MSLSRSRVRTTTRLSKDHPLWRYYAGRLASIWPSEQQINTWANHLLVIFCFGAPYLKEVRRPALFLLLILFLIRGHYVRYLSAPLRDPVILAFSLYFALHVIWLLGSDDLGYGIKIVHVADYLLYPLLFSTFIDRRFIPRMMGALALGLAVGVFWGLGIYFGILPPHPHGGGRWGVPGSPSPTANPLPWSFVLSVSFALVIVYTLRFFRRPRYMFPLGALAALTLLAIFVNPQRTGWILTAALLLLVLLAKAVKKRTFYLSIYLLAAAGAGFLAYEHNPVFRQHADATLLEIHSLAEQGRFTGAIGWRIGIVYYGLRAVRDHWLLGLGTGDHIAAIKEAWLQSEPNPALDVSFLGHPHQEYISALLQFGIIGLLVFLNIIVQLARYPGRDADTRLGFQILALAIALYSFVNLFVMRSTSTLLAVTIVALGLQRYWVSDVRFSRLDIGQIAGYVLAFVLLYAASLL